MAVEDPGVEVGVVRAPYRAPTLSVFGPLTRLTASGSGADLENKGADNQPTKRP
jgi:hypothetical protein